MNANTPNSATFSWPPKSEGTTHPPLPAADTEVPTPRALNPLATAIDLETLRESWQFAPTHPSIAQRPVEVAIIDLEPQAENGTTNWLDFFPPERDRVSSPSTSDLVASPRPSTRFVFVPIPPAVPSASSTSAVRENEQSVDAVVMPTERLMRYRRRTIHIALNNVSTAARAVVEVTRRRLEFAVEASRLRLTSGSQISRRARRVATVSAIAMALTATFVYLPRPSVGSTPAGNTPRAYQPAAASNDDLASVSKLVPSRRISGAASLVPVRDPSSDLSIEASRSGIGTRDKAARHVRLAAAASPAVQKKASPLAERSSGTPFTGALVVTSDPAGAEVSINGVSHGRTPLVIQSLPAGNRIVRLDLPGYDRWSRSVGVVANKRTSVSVTLRPETGPFVPKTGAARY